MTDYYGTICGGRNNQAGDNAGTTGDAPYAAVGGGTENIAGGHAATVGGGQSNHASDTYATIGGGDGNTASGHSATISGGEANDASGIYAAVGGGWGNSALGYASTGSGGYDNTALSHRATIGGGTSNSAHNYGTVGGGHNNDALGYASTIPGGESNSAQGNHSFSAGHRAKASHQGAFVWADSTDADFASTASDQFNVRASGGARIFSDPAATVGVELLPGATSWSVLSDRNLKENFAPVDGREILESLSLISITEWNLKSQVPSIRHIGPMAQDFYAAFGLGESDRYITSSDADGIALVSIQALYELSLEKDRRIAQLTQELKEKAQEIEELQAQMETLLERMAKLERGVETMNAPS